MGMISSDEPVSKTAVLLIKDPEQIQVTDFTSSSEYVTAEQVSTSQDSAGSRIELEITVNPGLPPGRLNQSITAHSNSQDHPKAVIRISGEIKGDISLDPDMLRFDRYPSDSSKTVRVQRLRIVNESKARPLQVLSVDNPSGHLTLEIETVKPGELYEVTATLNEEVLTEGTYFSGTINIKTDDPRQKSINARYMIYNRE